MKSRNFSLDLLKIILSIFIILLHCRFFIEYNLGASYLATEGLFRIAVPLFFLINGYFFYYTIKHKGLKKWLIRVISLYIIWMLLYSPLWFSLHIKSIINNIIIGYHHLWYIKALFLCGVILFFIRKMNKRYILTLSLVLLIIGVAIQYLSNFHIIPKNTPLHRNFIFLGLPFFSIGYLINKNNWLKIMDTKNIILLISVSFILLIFESYFNYHYTEERIDNLFSLIIICPLIFIYTINLNLSYKKSKKIALISTAIYLIHPWVMNFLNGTFKLSPSILSIATIFISFFLSLFIIKINTRIKYLL